MSRIAYFCIPAQGHTNPTLAVVAELVRRGHEVKYYSFHALKDKIEATGAEFISCDDYNIEMQLKPEDGERIAKDIAFSTEVMVKTTLAMDDTIIREMAKWKPDCIVADSVAIWGKLAAMKLGIPFMSSTTTFAFNKHSASIMKRSFSQLVSMLIALPKANRFVKRLRDKGYPAKNVLSLISNDNDTHTIVYTSRRFQPFADTFSDKYTFVGPSITHREYQVTKSDKKIIYISLGTVNNIYAGFYRNCFQALGGTDLEIIMSIGEFVDSRELGDIPDNFFVFPKVDQMEVLHKADVFLTHCGMNSVNEALYCGVPLVLFPQTAEQGSVASRVNELEAGLYLQDASAEAIRQAVDTVLLDERFKKNAREISEEFQQCGGYRLAADKIEELTL